MSSGRLGGVPLKQKLTLLFSFLTLVLSISDIILHPYYREYVRQTLQPIYPPLVLLGPCIYLSFGIALTLLAFKEVRIKRLRSVLLLVGFVPVITYTLLGFCFLAGMDIGGLSWMLIQLQQYRQLFFFPGIFIGMGLNHSS